MEGLGWHIVPRRDDIVADGSGEQEGILHDHGHAAAQGVRVPLSDIPSVDADGSRFGQMEAPQELGQGGFAGSGRADQGDGAAGVDLKGDVPQHGFTGKIAERHLVKGNMGKGGVVSGRVVPVGLPSGGEAWPDCP